jgi:hypothetical protein
MARGATGAIGTIQKKDTIAAANARSAIGCPFRIGTA